jgi:two-component system, response regulator YesN
MGTAGFGNMTLDDLIRTVYADKVLREMLSEPASSWDSFRARLELVGCHLPDNANVICVVQIGRTASQEDDQPTGEDHQHWRRRMEAVIGKQGAVFAIGGNRMGLLVTQMETADLERWQHALSEEFMQPVCIGVGIPARTPGELSRSFKEARRAIQMRFYLGNTVIRAEGQPDFRDTCEDPLANPEALYEQYLHCTGVEEVRLHIGTFFRLLLEPGPLPAQLVQEVSIRFLFGMERFVEQVSDGQVKLEKSHLMRLATSDTLDSICEYLSYRIHDMLVAVRTHLSGNGRDIVAKILQEMEADCKNVSLNTLAQQFFLSPAYLSLLFKTNTGKTFTDRLTDIRILKAKQLLIGSNMKTYEIAETVGYHDTRYFSQIFRKKVGVLPSEYKDWLFQPIFRDVPAKPDKERDPLASWQGSLLPTLDGTPSARIQAHPPKPGKGRPHLT